MHAEDASSSINWCWYEHERNSMACVRLKPVSFRNCSEGQVIVKRRRGSDMVLERVIVEQFGMNFNLGAALQSSIQSCTTAMVVDLGCSW